MNKMLLSAIFIVFEIFTFCWGSHIRNIKGSCTIYKIPELPLLLPISLEIGLKKSRSSTKKTIKNNNNNYVWNPIMIYKTRNKCKSFQLKTCRLADEIKVETTICSKPTAVPLSQR